MQRSLGRKSRWGNGAGHLLGEEDGLRGPEAEEEWAVLLVHAVIVVTAFQKTGLGGVYSHPPENMTFSLLCSRDCCCFCCVTFHYQR